MNIFRFDSGPVWLQSERVPIGRVLAPIIANVFLWCIIFCWVVRGLFEKWGIFSIHSMRSARFRCAQAIWCGIRDAAVRHFCMKESILGTSISVHQALPEQHIPTTNVAWNKILKYNFLWLTLFCSYAPTKLLSYMDWASSSKPFQNTFGKSHLNENFPDCLLIVVTLDVAKSKLEMTAQFLYYLPLSILGIDTSTHLDGAMHAAKRFFNRGF